MKKIFFLIIKIFLTLILFIVGVFVLVAVFTTPKNDRDWTVDQSVLPYAVFEGEKVHIKNIRNFSYKSDSEYTPAYYDKTFDLSKIKKMYYIVEPFAGFSGSAHTFLSFEFEGDNFIAISVEIRKEKGESFSAVKGLFNRYELMYVIADERDVVKLRSNYRKDKVYIYPIKTTPERVKLVFVDMLERTNKLKEKPEFYNSIWNNCTSNVASHANNIVPGRVPMMNLDVLLPEYSAKLAHKLGLIDTTLPFEKAQEYFLVNDRAEKYADNPMFSKLIRFNN